MDSTVIGVEINNFTGGDATVGCWQGGLARGEESQDQRVLVCGVVVLVVVAGGQSLSGGKEFLAVSLF